MKFKTLYSKCSNKLILIDHSEFGFPLGWTHISYCDICKRHDFNIKDSPISKVVIKDEIRTKLC